MVSSHSNIVPGNKIKVFEKQFFYIKNFGINYGEERIDLLHGESNDNFLRSVHKMVEKRESWKFPF